ncbi:hypothetical protein MLD38_015949 [Melastoma candidum]|uniref:Uncharacterized protein n=1 Tax=Melastoma candidum TaxID=119954 RepID=A0ACB9RRA4_9MYRT|nr:hypothetical protein MLD38_015949 [Melastoma candidum]
MISTPFNPRCRISLTFFRSPKMNSAIKATVSGPQRSIGFVPFRCSFFHSTPVLERKRRTHWESRSSQFSRKFRRLRSKHTMLSDIHAYADMLLQGWQDGAYNSDEPPLGTEAWFRSSWTRGFTGERNRKQQSYRHRQRGFQFYDNDDSDVETIFKSAFSGDKFFHWSFIRDEDPHWWGNSRNHSRRYQRFEYQRAFCDDDYDSSPESDAVGSSSSTSDRLALGLKASGPLKIDDVKNAYRSCALKWHPDRHQGSSKAVAEEKFKICSAAYQSLCDKLALN